MPYESLQCEPAAEAAASGLVGGQALLPKGFLACNRRRIWRGGGRLVHHRSVQPSSGSGVNGRFAAFGIEAASQGFAVDSNDLSVSNFM